MRKIKLIDKDDNKFIVKNLTKFTKKIIYNVVFFLRFHQDKENIIKAGNVKK